MWSAETVVVRSEMRARQEVVSGQGNPMRVAVTDVSYLSEDVMNRKPPVRKGKGGEGEASKSRQGETAVCVCRRRGKGWEGV